MNNKIIIPIIIILLLIPFSLSTTYNINLTKEDLTNNVSYEFNPLTYFFTNPHFYRINQPFDDYNYWYDDTSNDVIPLHDLLTGNKGLKAQLYYPHSQINFPSMELLFINNTGEFQTQLNITSYGETGKYLLDLNDDNISVTGYINSLSNSDYKGALRHGYFTTVNKGNTGSREIEVYYNGNYVSSLTDEIKSYLHSRSISDIVDFYYIGNGEFFLRNRRQVFIYDDFTKNFTHESINYGLETYYKSYYSESDNILYLYGNNINNGFYYTNLSLIRAVDIETAPSDNFVYNNKGYIIDRLARISTNIYDFEQDTLNNVYNISIRPVLMDSASAYKNNIINMDDYLLVVNSTISLTTGISGLYVLYDMSNLEPVSSKYINSSIYGEAKAIVKIDDNYYIVYSNKINDYDYLITYFDINFNVVSQFNINANLNPNLLLFYDNYIILREKITSNPYPSYITTYDLINDYDNEHTFNIYYIEEEEEPEPGPQLNIFSDLIHFFDGTYSGSATSIDLMNNKNMAWTTGTVGGEGVRGFGFDVGAASVSRSGYLESNLEVSNFYHSISFWFYTYNVSYGRQGLFGTSSGNFPHGYSFEINNDILYLGLHGLGSVNGYKNLGYTNSNEWYHLLLTYDNDSVKVYLNNSLILNESIGSYSMNEYNFFSFGRAQSRIGYNTYFYYGGRLDEILIYNRTLTSEEVSILYNNHSSISYEDLENLLKVTQKDNISNINILIPNSYTINLNNYYGNYNNYTLSFNSELLTNNDVYEDDNIKIITQPHSIKYESKSNVTMSFELVLYDEYDNNITSFYDVTNYYNPFSDTNFESPIIIYDYAAYNLNLNNLFSNYELVDYYLYLYNPFVSNISNWELIDYFTPNTYEEYPEFNLSVETFEELIIFDFDTTSNECKDITLFLSPIKVYDLQGGINRDYGLIINNTCYTPPQRTSKEFITNLEFNYTYEFNISEYFETETHNAWTNYFIYYVDEDLNLQQISIGTPLDNDYITLTKESDKFIINTKFKQTTEPLEIYLSVTNAHGSNAFFHAFEILEHPIQKQSIPNINVPYEYNFSIDLETYFYLERVNNFIITFENEDKQLINYNFNTGQNIFRDNIYFTMNIIDNIIYFTSKNEFIRGTYTINAFALLSEYSTTDTAIFRITSYEPNIYKTFPSIIMKYDENKLISLYDHFDYFNLNFYYVALVNPDTLENIFVLPDEKLITSKFDMTLINGVISIDSKDTNFETQIIIGTCTSVSLEDNETSTCVQQENILFKISDTIKTDIIGGLFPSGEELTSKQKFIRVFITMIAIIGMAIILTHDKPESKSYMIPIVSILLVFAFIFFVYIGYISTWIFILTIFIGLIIGIGIVRNLLIGNTSS